MKEYLRKITKIIKFNKLKTRKKEKKHQTKNENCINGKVIKKNKDGRKLSLKWKKENKKNIVILEN